MRFEYINETGSMIPVPCCYADCLELVRSDWFRYYGYRPSLLGIVRGLRNVHTGFSFWLRFSAFGGYFPEAFLEDAKALSPEIWAND